MLIRPAPELECWYDVEGHVDYEWFATYVDRLAQLATNAENVRVEAWMRPFSQSRRSIFYTLESAKAFVRDNWNEIEETVVTQLSGRVRHSTLHHQHHYLRIRVDDIAETPATVVLNELQAEMHLV